MKRMLTAYYSEESGELVKVDWSPTYEHETLLMQADVLQDLLQVLHDAYMAAASEWLGVPVAALDGPQP